MYNRKHVNEKIKYWKPGDPVTEKDLRVLHPIIKKAEELGRSPTKSDVKDVHKIKHRFRTWENALLAAGLPSLLNKEQQQLRDVERKKMRQGAETGAETEAEAETETETEAETETETEKGEGR